MGLSFMFNDKNGTTEFAKISQGISSKYEGKGLSIKTGEVFSNDITPVVALENGKPSLLLMKWGFPKRGSTDILEAARSETASKRRRFASPLARRRCVIPTTGFIDWEKAEDGSKKKIICLTPDNPMLYITGIYCYIKNHGNDKSIAGRFVVLTQAGSRDITGKQNRMPVIIYKDEINRWLTDLSFAKTIMNRNTVPVIRTTAERRNASSKDSQAG
jgi:putative SOS response-associated peptidase YedK